MKPVIIFLLSCAIACTACSQRDSAAGKIPDVRLYEIPIGLSTARVQQLLFDTASPFLLLLLHSNELTAGETARDLAYREGINLVQLLNNGNRLLTFNHHAKTFQFDPNRIFSDQGIRKTLALTSTYSDAAFTELTQFRDFLLSFLPQGKPVVSVHNNTHGRFTILQYKDGGMARMHVNEAQDIDDFFITNDEGIFSLLKEENYNVVLEDASQMEDDGSLSLYCERKGIRYINVEAEHGHRQQQAEMLNIILRLFR